MPPDSAIIRYEFPARHDPAGAELPPCTLTWYDSGQKPPRPPEMEGNLEDNGSLFIGDKGKLFRGSHSARPRLLPESRMVDYKRPPKTIPRAPANVRHLEDWSEHHQDWIRACKGGPPPCSNFDISGPFTEWVLLGNLATRLGKKLQWDSKKLRVTNAPEAAELIRGPYRKDWEV
jgi:hypothetical protein